jgi:hypothetical protein
VRRLLSDQSAHTQLLVDVQSDRTRIHKQSLVSCPGARWRPEFHQRQESHAMLVLAIWRKRRHLSKPCFVKLGGTAFGAAGHGSLHAPIPVRGDRLQRSRTSYSGSRGGGAAETGLPPGASGALNYPSRYLTVEFGMSKQQLNGAQVLCTSIYQRCLGPPHRVRAITAGSSPSSSTQPSRIRAYCRVPKCGES